MSISVCDDEEGESRNMNYGCGSRDRTEVEIIQCGAAHGSIHCLDNSEP